MLVSFGSTNAISISIPTYWLSIFLEQSCNLYVNVIFIREVKSNPGINPTTSPLIHSIRNTDSTFPIMLSNPHHISNATYMQFWQTSLLINLNVIWCLGTLGVPCYLRGSYRSLFFCKTVVYFQMFFSLWKWSWFVLLERAAWKQASIFLRCITGCCPHGSLRG